MSLCNNTLPRTSASTNPNYMCRASTVLAGAPPEWVRHYRPSAPPLHTNRGHWPCTHQVAGNRGQTRSSRREHLCLLGFPGARESVTIMNLERELCISSLRTAHFRRSEDLRADWHCCTGRPHAHAYNIFTYERAHTHTHAQREWVLRNRRRSAPT